MGQESGNKNHMETWCSYINNRCAQTLSVFSITINNQKRNWHGETSTRSITCSGETICMAAKANSSESKRNGSRGSGGNGSGSGAWRDNRYQYRGNQHNQNKSGINISISISRARKNISARCAQPEIFSGMRGILWRCEGEGCAKYG